MVKLSVLELVLCLSDIIDLMSEEIRDHHKRVACGAYQLCGAMGIEGEELRDIVIAAALHDIGGLSLEARKCAALHFEDTNSHAEKGYKLLSEFALFENIATLVRYHHTKWNYGNGTKLNGEPLPLGSQIILMADRVAVTLTPGIHTLNQAGHVVAMVQNNEGKIYKPELVEAFTQASQKDAFWLNIMSSDYYEGIIKKLKANDILLEDAHLDEMLDLLSNIVDFRSVFTTVHSKGVAAVAQELAMLTGQSEEDCYLMKVAALLHDIGKLAVPSEIIEKPGPLSEYERDVIRTHSYFTDKVVSRLSGLEKVRSWAAHHHENLNGMGYPFGYGEEDLLLGARIMKVADVFVALTENRPYREGMPAETALEIMWQMVEEGEIDPEILTVLTDNSVKINSLRAEVEIVAAQKYENFLSETE